VFHECSGAFGSGTLDKQTPCLTKYLGTQGNESPGARQAKPTTMSSGLAATGQCRSARKPQSEKGLVTPSGDESQTYAVRSRYLYALWSVSSS